MTKITETAGGMSGEGSEGLADESAAPTLIERASRAVTLRAERFEAYKRHLIDRDDARAREELARLDAECAALDLRVLAHELRQEFVGLKAAYERLDFQLTMPDAEPDRFEVENAQAAKNLERHGHAVPDRILQDAIDGTILTGREGINYRKLRPQRVEAGPPPITAEERPYG